MRVSDEQRRPSILPTISERVADLRLIRSLAGC